jgi:hypothetical protein
MMLLLSRDSFRGAVFTRDKHKCVCCGNPGKDAHHIIERRLFPDGGYYLDNGATVCAECHMDCETTDISVEEVREAAGIKKPVLPPHFYDDQVYDKWGNIILTNGRRLRGELFNDESVQKALKNHLDKFEPHVKYPRTHHLPWSENIVDDERVMPSIHDLELADEIVITEKMDGENTTMYRDYIHARSIDSKNHESRNWVKNFWSKLSGDIPEGWRVCGENLYAKHSIGYDRLPSYFVGFSIWDDRNTCLGYDDTLEWFRLLGITPVPVIYRGKFAKFNHKKYWTKEIAQVSEGYVVSVTHSFGMGAFKYCVGKFVRKNHVQTVKHWMHGQRMEINHLDQRIEDHLAGLDTQGKLP